MKKINTKSLIIYVILAAVIIVAAIMYINQSSNKTSYESCYETIEALTNNYEKTSHGSTFSSKMSDLVALVTKKNAQASVSGTTSLSVSFKNLCPDSGTVTFVMSGQELFGFCSTDEKAYLPTRNAPYQNYSAFCEMLTDYKSSYQSANISSSKLTNAHIRYAYYMGEGFNNQSSWPSVTLDGAKYDMEPYFDEGTGTISLIGVKENTPYSLKGQLKAVSHAQAYYVVKKDCWYLGSFSLKNKTSTQILSGKSNKAVAKY